MIVSFFEITVVISTGLAIGIGLTVAVAEVVSMLEVCCNTFVFIVGLENVKFVA